MVLSVIPQKWQYLGNKIPKNGYFWRNTDQQEVDFVLEKDGELSVVEVKYNENKVAKLPNAFEQAYHPKKFAVINRANYIEMLGGS